MSHETIIKIDKLFKEYPVESEKKGIEVLRGVDVEIRATDFCILYGPSGSGKSTLLHHIVGLELPTSGKITIRGKDITKMTDEERAILRSEKFGMVYQFWYWAKSLTVWENVAMPLYIGGEDEKKAKEKAMAALGEIDMTKYAYKHPAQLSGGEQQRIGLARALVNNPWIIVADEPTGNLDTHNADIVMGLLQKLHSKKRTVIMVTHNLIYLPLATKTIAMKDGKVVSSGSEEVKKQIKQELKSIL